MFENLLSSIICVLILFISCKLVFDFNKIHKKKFIILVIGFIILRTISPIRDNLHLNLLYATFLYISVPFFSLKDQSTKK